MPLSGATLRAFSLLREQPWYRREAFHLGLRHAGYEVVAGRVEPPRKGDILLVWNRYGASHIEATKFEKEGGIVLVAENGYLGAGGTAPKFEVHPSGPKPGSYYALALHGHNGQGEWPVGGPERFEALGVEVKPWRTEGEHVLVCPNRAFGIPGRAMAPDWADRAAKHYAKQTKRPIRIRAHPGNNAPARPLSEDLKGAWAVVIWSSSAGIAALVEGIPVYCEAPFWICRGARAMGPIDGPITPDRMPHLQAMAWAQFQLSEIEDGWPFKQLLYKQGKLA
jgi:hypothetical protein